MIDELYEKVQDYLNMEEEIDFKEFQAYYKKVTDYLQAEGQNFDEDKLWKGLLIVESIASNASNRAKEIRKGPEVKKYKRMNERMKLWAQNFTKRLAELGYTDEDINERFHKMLEEREEANKDS
ncbi:MULTISPECIES: hypothetical protein [Geomicrobium]|uniref:Phage protein n=1 Tax=Geomicrobium sediminis TaxID=1347788 RepID=A0ABS2PDX8_9BACL|nr:MULTISPECIES: hypothetical protein [Geomicrobium]MBM7633624.1 hypothetical protein [Geomicrobium sediminis]GAK06560.1 hypothetical protein JCM19038_262 [Geomicrobium sp. JCM 19038]